MMNLRFPLVSFISLILVGPVSAQQDEQTEISAETVLALKELQHLDQRMNAAGWRLASANTAYCNGQVSRAGILLHDIEQYGDQAAVRFALGFNGPIAINAVAPDSPAANAGLSAGDDIVAINGLGFDTIDQDDPALASEPPQYRRIATVNQLLAEAMGSGAVTLDILRGGQKRLVTVEPKRVCPSRFQIRVSKDRNASANGKMVSITSAMAEYVISDDELAAIAAHELSHNLLGHRERLNTQKVNRGFFGQFGKSAKRIKTTEIEADRLSIWLMANAGYDPTAAIRFWTRYGKEHGKGIFSASTHYRWKKRVKLFAEEIAKMEQVAPTDGKRSPPLLVEANQ